MPSPLECSATTWQQLRSLKREEKREEGREEERIKNARNFKTLGVSTEIISQATELSPEEDVSEQETLVGNEFTVSLRLKVDIGQAMQTNNVRDTVSYADVYEAVKAECLFPLGCWSTLPGAL